MLETVKSHRVAGGELRYCRHDSAATGTPMTFSVFTPDGPGPFPVLLWLSGLTCTEDNFTTKAGAYPAAAEHGMIIVAPDTSPRGQNVADDPAYDLGQGAGFYVDATEAPWAPHFRMESWLLRGSHPADPRELSGRSGSHWRFRPFDGRAWRAHACIAPYRTFQVGLSIRADCLTDELSVGRESVHRISRRRPHDMARPRCLRPAAKWSLTWLFRRHPCGSGPR